MGVVEELRAEQAHIDRAYARLDELRSSASSLAEDVIGLGRGGSLADRVDRDARVQLALARRAALSVGEHPLCFGRLDTDGGDRLYIGRLGVSDEIGRALDGRLAGTGCRGLLPGHQRGPTGSGPAPPHPHERPPGRRG